MTGCTAGREICGDGLDNDCDELRVLRRHRGTVPVQTFMSHPLVGAEARLCTGNDMAR